MTKSAVIQLRCTFEEKESWEEQALKTRKSLSDWIRARLQPTPSHPDETPEIPEKTAPLPQPSAFSCSNPRCVRLGVHVCGIRQ